MFYACEMTLEIVYILSNIEFYAPRVCALQSDSLASLHEGRELSIAPCSEMISLFCPIHRFTALTHPQST